MTEGSNPEIELRSNGTDMAWCVIYEGRPYPFGPDSLAKELAEWSSHRMEKDHYVADDSFSIKVEG